MRGERVPVLAATAISHNATDSLSGLALRDAPKPDASSGCSLVRVVSSPLNVRDLWTLRGVGHAADRFPVSVGCHAAAYDEERNGVVVHLVLGDPDAGRGDDAQGPKGAALSGQHDKAFAGYLTVPACNLVPKPAWLSFDEAACLPVAWTTAYRMLFAQLRIAVDRVPVQGVGGGVASAAIKLAVAAGAVVYATSHSETTWAEALAWSARAAVLTGERLPTQVDEGQSPTPEQRARGEERAVRAGRDFVAGSADMIPMDPARDSRLLDRLEKRRLAELDSWTVEGWPRRAADPLTRCAPGSSLMPPRPRLRDRTT